MPHLPGRPDVDALVDRLDPLDLVWSEARDRWGIVARADRPETWGEWQDRALHEVEGGPLGSPYVVAFPPSANPVQLDSLADGWLPRVRSPEILRPAVAALAAASPTPSDGSPIRLTWRHLDRSGAPSTWRLCAVLRSWGIEIGAVLGIDGFLMVVQDSRAGIMERHGLDFVRYHVDKLARVAEDQRRQGNPVLSLLGDAALEDLEDAVRYRIGREGERLLELAATGFARASTEKGRAQVERRLAARWLVLENTFRGPGDDALRELLDRLRTRTPTRMLGA